MSRYIPVPFPFVLLALSLVQHREQVICFVTLRKQFRAARKASEEVGAQLVLGDRPIEITVCNYLFLS